MMRTALALCLLAAAARPEATADEHMLAGARHFQAGRYAEALVEFRVAERIGDGGATWYAAATLVKLKRPEDAVVEFARAEAVAPAERDALFDYHHALGCYEARLYFCADRLLAAVGDESGPRIAAQARKIRADLAPLLSAPPAVASIDWYHAQAKAASDAGRPALATAYYEEAIALAALRPDRHRRHEAVAGLARARGDAKQSARVP
jgi:tetratricopeptide (TPR) repeat protein